MKVSGIYKIICKVTGKFYVGSAISYSGRKHNHLGLLKKGVHHCAPLQNAWKKYGADSFEFQLVEEAPIEKLILVEQSYLDRYWDQGVLFNICRYAYSPLGTKQSEESCRKRSIKLKGLKRTPEQIERMRQAHIGLGKGKKQTAATKNKIRLANLGRVVTPETRQKLSRSRMGNNYGRIGKNHPQYGTKKSVEFCDRMGKSKSFLWLITFPDGSKEEVWNLRAFCRKYTLNHSNMRQRGKCKGYYAIKLSNTTFKQIQLEASEPSCSTLSEM